MYKIMLIEDDFRLREQVADSLRLHRYEVYTVSDFRNVLSEVNQIVPDLVVLDMNLPYLDGNEICRFIREKYHMPIIVTSARNAECEQILSMELGCDDYLVKPFHINVLISHIAACIRRTYGAYCQSSRESSDLNGLQLDERGMRLLYQEQVVDLSKNEYILMKIFFDSPGVVVTREELLEAIWDDKEFVDDNTLTVNVTRIKKKLEKLGFAGVIKTKRSVGYLFAMEEIQ